MAGNRIGYVAGPAAAIAEALKLSTHTVYAAPTAAQLAALRILEGAGDAWIARTRDAYRSLGEAAADRLGVPRPEGSTFLFLDVAPRLDDRGLTGFLEDAADRGLLAFARPELRPLPHAREGLLHVRAAGRRPSRSRGPRLAPRAIAAPPGAIVAAPSGGEESDGVRGGARGRRGPGCRPPRRRRQRGEPRPPLAASRHGGLRGGGGLLRPRGARGALRGAVRRRPPRRDDAGDGRARGAAAHPGPLRCHRVAGRHGERPRREPRPRRSPAPRGQRLRHQAARHAGRPRPRRDPARPPPGQRRGHAARGAAEGGAGADLDPPRDGRGGLPRLRPLGAVDGRRGRRDARRWRGLRLAPAGGGVRRGRRLDRPPSRARRRRAPPGGGEPLRVRRPRRRPDPRPAGRPPRRPRRGREGGLGRRRDEAFSSVSPTSSAGRSSSTG